METPLLSYRAPVWAQGLSFVPSYRLSLGQLPTPLLRWEPEGVPEGIELWIKRDDRTGAELSGNKVRKLEFLLADALDKKSDVVLTCGGIQSNHCRATAVAARQFLLDSYLLLRTSDPEAPVGLVGNLLLDHLVGASVIPISREQYQRRESLLESLAKELVEEGRRPYIIPEGGSNGVGTWGYIEAIREIAEGAAQEGIAFDDIVFACGSGGTAAGLALATKLGDFPWRVHAVNVCDDAAYFHGVINRIYKEMEVFYRSEELLDIVDGYKGLGYAISRKEELELIANCAKQTGVILDPVYSGKAFYGLLQELQNNRERFQGRRILFIHTGGLFGLYDKAEEIAPFLATQTMTSWAKGK